MGMEEHQSTKGKLLVGRRLSMPTDIGVLPSEPAMNPFHWAIQNSNANGHHASSRPACLKQARVPSDAVRLVRSALGACLHGTDVK